MEWSGKELDESEAFFMRLFQKVLDGGFSFAPYRTVEEELLFFRQWFLFALKEYGVTEKTGEKADFLTEHLWYLKKEPYPETVGVLSYFKEQGVKLGVISDGPPSLQLTLESCGLHHYFDSFTASSLVGVGKPDPRIFEAALRTLHLQPEECIYVDDTEIEAEGARKLGFLSFWLQRLDKPDKPWTISTLRELIPVYEAHR